MERATLLSFKDRSIEKVITEKLMQLVASRITEWSLQSYEKEVWSPMPISVDWIKRLHPMIFQRLVNVVVWSIDGGDLDPNLTTKQIEDQLDSEIEALISKTAQIEQRLEDARKN